ncbi:50S ribosomal protein L19 [Candidatus Uhrbacteria bacterium]|nr:50S ribosomal protein L19 [Candidatus Uhrbacteria bacterium]
MTDEGQDPQTEVETPVQAPTEAQEEETPAEPVVVEEVKRDRLHRDLRPGMIIRVHEKIKDVTPSGEERVRVQVFEGTVVALGGSGIGRTMTVRKVSKGYGVEKIYPLAVPTIEKVEILKTMKVRRAKLSFLRPRLKEGRPTSRLKRALRERKKSL